MSSADLSSYALSNGRMGVIAPAGAGNFFSSPSPNEGRGQAEWEQGYVSIKGQIDRNRLDTQARDGTADRRSVYAWISEGSGDVIGGDVVYNVPDSDGTAGRRKNFKSHTNDDGQLVDCISTFAGFGGDIAAAFPTDENMQREAVEFYCQPLGIAHGGARYNNQALVGSSFAIQTRGVISKPPALAVNVGQRCRFRAPLPSKLRHQAQDSTIQAIARPTFEIEPHTPETFSTCIQTHIRNYLNNQNKYMQAISGDYHKSHAIMTAMDHIFSFMRTSFVLQLYSMLSVLGINALVLPADYNFLSGVGVITLENFILGLARCTDVIDQRGADIPGVEITDVVKENWTKLAMQMLQSTFYSGELAQLGFGWDETTSKNQYINLQSKHIITDIPGGELLNLQFNAHRFMWSGVGQFVNKELALSRLTCTKSANPDEVGAFLL